MNQLQDETSKKLREDHHEINITGRLDKYRSPYWAGAVAALGMRYIPRPFWKKKFEAPDTTDTEFLHKHKYAGVAGLLMYAVAGIYAYRTQNDIRSIFNKAVAYETGKEEKDVGLMDFWKSDNTVVQQTVNNYIKRNALRFGMNSVFFAPFLMKGTMRKYNLGGETGIDWGVGANAAYLFSDVLFRKMSPFEELQSLIDRKINHAEHFADKIVATDLLDVYERHAINDVNESFMGQRGTPRWDRSMQLFDRMADLINQTYKNVVAHEQSSFGFPEFIYLMGHQLITPSDVERSATYVEVANKFGIAEVKTMQADLKNGKTLDEIKKQYGLDKTSEAAIVEPASNVEKRFAMPQLKKNFGAVEGSMVAREDARRAEQGSIGLSA